MQVTCGSCHARYDDAVCWTSCPHARFISDAVAAQKDLAYTLLGKRVVFAHEPPGDTPRRVRAMEAMGLIELEGMRGQFAPHLFTVVD